MIEGRQRRILVIDDEPVVADLLSEILTIEGHDVDTARNGRTALVKMENKTYENIITDIRMPEMDGRELHSRIYETDPELASNIIFITGDTTSDDMSEYLNKTGNVYLEKPFKPQELLDTISKVMIKP